jgi:hypothetical protein|uniref:Retrotransposon Copia-like N-terminal domain-containing protein n=1 Tax=Arabidopsis thaliana TaxID=3702 RepID=Q0WVQ8_ARATH|nr:hypothetical protein [Arabidopsis thaliana]
MLIIRHSRSQMVSPGNTLVSEVLDGSNFSSWKIAMFVSLNVKNKIAFVDGTLPRPPESDPSFRVWSRCNSMVKSRILNSVTKQIYKSILRFNDAAEIWKDLDTRFHITNLPRSYQLTQQIWSLQSFAFNDISFSPSTLWLLCSLTSSRQVLSQNTWIIDSGVTHHVSYDRNMFESLSDGLRLVHF